MVTSPPDSFTNRNVLSATLARVVLSEADKAPLTACDVAAESAAEATRSSVTFLFSKARAWNALAKSPRESASCSSSEFVSKIVHFISASIFASSSASSRTRTCSACSALRTNSESRKDSDSKSTNAAPKPKQTALDATRRHAFLRAAAVTYSACCKSATAAFRNFTDSSSLSLSRGSLKMPIAIFETSETKCSPPSFATNVRERKKKLVSIGSVRNARGRTCSMSSGETLLFCRKVRSTPATSPIVSLKSTDSRTAPAVSRKCAKSSKSRYSSKRFRVATKSKLDQCAAKNKRRSFVAFCAATVPLSAPHTRLTCKSTSHAASFVTVSGSRVGSAASRRERRYSANASSWPLSRKPSAVASNGAASPAAA